jgi:peptidoglycan hydrolase-like protein with peptidoglycan-binding domain
VLTAPLFDDTAEVPGYVSVDEVPDELLDPHPAIEEEGDDGRLAANPFGVPDDPKLTPPSGEVRSLMSAAPLPDKSRARIVPHRRDLKRGMRGKDVIATKRALSHAGYLKWPKKWTLLAGPYWARAVRAFQKDKGLHVDGVYGLNTHRALVQAGHFDKYGALLMAQAPRGTTDKQQAARDRLEAIALYGYHWRASIGYTQSPARMDVVRHHVQFPWFQHVRWLWEDCSSYFTALYYSAKLPDPNRNGYNGIGFTGTLRAHGTRVTNYQRGDAAHYGFGEGRHVATHIGHGTRCVSHGSSAGPLLLSTFRYRSDYDHSRSYF